MSSGESKANAIMNYSFLVAFANDGTVDRNELEFIKKLALKDGVVDEEEKNVLKKIFERAESRNLDKKTSNEIKQFRSEYGF